MFLLLEVMWLDLLKNELPHVFHCIQTRVGALVDVESRRVYLLTVLFYSLVDIVFERISTFFDLDGTTVQHPPIESECLIHTVPIGKLLNVEIFTIVTYLDTSSFYTLETGPTLPKNLLR